MLTMSTYSEKSWNSSEDYEDDNSSTSSPVQRRIKNGETHCVGTVIKHTVVKPGDKQLHDPLQFVKIKTCELSKKAKEQIKLAEEVKITKEKIKEVEEEWQNNLLSWKSKRRQTKRNSDEELNSINNSRKIKTFNEILNEKKKSGHRIGYNLHHYLMNDDDDNLIDQSASESTESNDNKLDQSNREFNENNNKLDELDNCSVNIEQKRTNELNNENNELNNHQQTTNNDKKENNLNNNESDQVITNTNLLKEYSNNNLSQNEFAQNNVSSSSSSINNNQINLFNENNCKLNHQEQIKKNESINNKKEDDNNQNEIKQDENKKLSFKAKLSAFENLAKVETKKPLEKTPPVKNKLRMSSSNNLITDKKLDDNDNKKEFAKKFTSKSNENLSKFRTNQQENTIDKMNKHQEFDFTKSESNLNINNNNLNNLDNKNQQYVDYQNIQQQQQINEHTQSDEQINQKNLNELNKYELINTRSSNEIIPTNKETVNSLQQQQQIDCDYEVSELSKRMHQLTASPNILAPNQNNTANNQLNETIPTNISTIHPSTNHSTIHTQSSFMNSIEELNPINQTNNNYFNDDYVNSQLFQNQQQFNSHNLINNNLQHLSDYPIDPPQHPTNQLYHQPVVNQQQSISTSMLPQAGQFYEEENVYGNYYNSANAYQLQKHNRSTSSSHLEYANGLPSVTNQMYYQNKTTSVLNASSGNLTNNNCLPTQSYSTSQLLNTRQSQPQLNMINTPVVTLNSQVTQPAQSYNYNHWLIQEAELRRQMATQNGSSLIASTKNQQNLQHQLKNNQLLNKQPVANIYKDDQPVYENTIIYNSHKKQQQLHQQLSNNYLNNNQQQIKPPYPNPNQLINTSPTNQSQQNYLQTQQQKQQKQILSVSGKKKCSNCGDELGRGCAAMVIESLSLYYHINCFRCSVCHIILGNGSTGTDVRVRDQKLNCMNCYSNEPAGLKFSRV